MAASVKVRQKTNICAINNNNMHYKTTNMHLIGKDVDICKIQFYFNKNDLIWGQFSSDLKRLIPIHISIYI